MKRACLVLLTISAMACSAVSKKANDLSTVTVGAAELSAIQIQRSMTLDPANKLPACLTISITLPDDNTTVAMQPTDAGCTLNVQQPSLTLFDQDEINKARDQIGPFDTDGVRSGKVTVEKLELSGADGSALALSQYVDALSVQVDGQTLLNKMSPSGLGGNDGLSSPIPGSVIDKLKSSVKSGQPASADVSLTLWLKADTLTDLPGSLKMNLVLQPELEVSLIGAL